MKDKIVNSFDQIHAEAELIDSTYNSLKNARLKNLNKDSVKKKHLITGYRPGIAFAMVVLLVLISVYKVNTQAFSYISIDALPSIELTLNKKDKIIDAKAFNKNGQEILKQVNVEGKEYKEGIEIILGCDLMKESLKMDTTLSLKIISEDSDKGLNLQKELNRYKIHHKYISDINMSEYSIYESAHKEGLSFGKYASYLELKEYDDNITTDQCHNMSMGEIAKEIQDHHQNHESSNKDCDDTHNNTQESSVNKKDDSCHQSDNKKNHSHEKKHH